MSLGLKLKADPVFDKISYSDINRNGALLRRITGRLLGSSAPYIYIVNSEFKPAGKGLSCIHGIACLSLKCVNSKCAE